MGDFTLGCLLGQYDKTQSFDVDSFAITTVVNSWVIGFSTDSAFFNMDVHSSNQGLNIDVHSKAENAILLSYSYRADNDIYGRWFSDVNTHSIRSDIWARTPVEANSGNFLIGLVSGLIPTSRIGYSDNLINHRLETFTTSNANANLLRVTAIVAINSNEIPPSFYLDDVITQVDWINIHPTYAFEENAPLIKSYNRTHGGKIHTNVWARYFAYSVPLQYLSDSHAALINWWWENQFNLAFTLDTSDSESTFLCRITNEQQPIAGRHTGRRDLWNGNIQLESIYDGRLVF